MYLRTTKLPPEIVLKLRKIAARDGTLRTAAALGSSPTLIEKILSHGQINPRAAERLAPLIEAMK